MPAARERLYLPGLDGLRAIAALGVMISHALKALDRFPGHKPHHSLELGRQGVTMFFTLSGFLITYLLLEEREQLGRIDLRAFYLRRILRIWPLYFCYLAIAMAYHAQTTGLALMVLFLSNVAFVTNRFPTDTAPLWSIGIEEQFYALWPLVLRHVRRVVPLLVFVIVALPTTRIIVHRALGPGRHVANDLLGTLGYDAMAVGALFAIAYRRATPRLMQLARSWLPHVLFVALVALLAANMLAPLHLFLAPVVALVTGLFIVAQIASPAPLLNLEQPLLRSIGRISFGVYVYHMLVITLLARALGTHVVPAPLLVVTICILTIGVASVSYRVLEAPFLRWKRRLARVDM